MKKIYVSMVVCGEYSDRNEICMLGFADEEKAQQHCEKVKKLLDYYFQNIKAEFGEPHPPVPFKHPEAQDWFKRKRAFNEQEAKTLLLYVQKLMPKSAAEEIWCNYSKSVDTYVQTIELAEES